MALVAYTHELQRVGGVRAGNLHHELNQARPNPHPNPNPNPNPSTLTLTLTLTLTPTPSQVYLHYIAAFYHQLPRTSVFLHGHHSSWHNRIPAAEQIRALDLDQMARYISPVSPLYLHLH